MFSSTVGLCTMPLVERDIREIAIILVGLFLLLMYSLVPLYRDLLHFWKHSLDFRECFSPVQKKTFSSFSALHDGRSSCCTHSQ
jgi:hypothetical protein